MSCTCENLSQRIFSLEVRRCKGTLPIFSTLNFEPLYKSESGPVLIIILI